MRLLASVVCSKPPVLGHQIDLKGIVRRFRSRQFPSRLVGASNSFYLVCIYADILRRTASSLDIVGPDGRCQHFALHDIEQFDPYVQITVLGDLVLNEPGNYELQVSAGDIRASVLLEAALHEDVRLSG